jgi:hypothetical protein
MTNYEDKATLKKLGLNALVLVGIVIVLIITASMVA